MIPALLMTLKQRESVPVAACDTCGAVCVIPHPDDVLAETGGWHMYENGEPISRCGVITETDAGEDACGGTVIFFGWLHCMLQP